MVALLDVGVIAIVVEKKVTPTLSSATIRVQNFKNYDKRFWLAEVEILSPGFIKLSGVLYTNSLVFLFVGAFSCLKLKLQRNQNLYFLSLVCR